MTCNICKGFGYLITAQSACTAGGERRPCPVCTPAPSIVTGSDERAQEAVLEAVRRRLAGMFPGEPRDNATVTVNVNDLTLALAASRPTDTGAGSLRLPDGPPGWDEDGMCNDHGRFACADCALPAALATPKPPVDEAMREAVRKLLLDRAVYFESAKGYREWKDAARSYRATADEVDKLFARNLTGDGAGA